VSLLHAADALPAQIEQAAARHRRGLVMGIVLALATFGITAIAIAPLTPDAAKIPQRLVTETVNPEPLGPQIAALTNHEFSLWRSDVTRGTDSPESLLARLGVVDRQAAEFMRRDGTARQLLSGRGGKMVRAEVAADGTLQSLVARYPTADGAQALSHFSRLTLRRFEGRWLAMQQTAPLGHQVRLASGTIRSTLYAATDEAGIPDAVASQLAEIFSGDVDFHRELKRGDTFSLVYQSLTADGEPVAWNEGAGRVLAAQFVNGRRVHDAAWFVANDGRGGYWSLDGRSRQRSFLASPMEFSRVTSGFAMRMHPILQRMKAHRGVDYAAPAGTGVRVVGEGTVTFAGWKNGYGKVVEVQHANNKATLYAHLSRIDVKKGQRIEQGTRIGLVGMTGWATGPHLHFEFLVAGLHQDPLTLARSSQPLALDLASRLRFNEASQTMRDTLEVAATLGRSYALAE
jgi:murein DD-endopeptidase MepM/ murein hydrolase activator NlpD